MKKKILILLLILLFLPACLEGSSGPTIEQSPIKIGDADFVFQSVDNENEDLLGFYTNKFQKVRLVNPPGNTILPFYIGPKTVVTIAKRGYPGFIDDRGGYLMVMQGSQLFTCYSPETFGINIKPHNGNILLSDSEKINLISSTDCSVLETILVKEDLSSLENDLWVNSYDFSSNEEFLVVSLGINLFRVNLPSKEIIDYKLVGVYPSISPNQEYIIYMGEDGIYIMKANGEESERVVRYYVMEDGEFYGIGNLPKPNWSMDGNKIIYHKCITLGKGSCHSIIDYDIYVYDLDSRKENLILHKGLNPSWNFYK